MAAFTVSRSSLPCLFLARVLILLAFHSPSAAFKDVEYTLLSKPSNQVSVIIYNNLGILNRVRRSDDAVQNNNLSMVSTPASSNSSVTTISSISTTTSTRTTSPHPKVSVPSSTTTTSTPSTTTPATTTPTTTIPPTTTVTSTTVTTPNATSTTVPTTKRIIVSSSSTSTVTTPITKVIKDNHIYYKSTIIQDAVNEHWVNFDDSVNAHKVLSDSHRMAASVQMKFKFRFFGHTVVNVTVATGGFLYMGPFLHQWLTATQYVAPMMANFDTSLGNNSDIKIKADGQQFVVQWHHVHLKDQNATTPFNFQASLDKSGKIKFMYKDLPILPDKISSEKHPVKIGLSDAYYIDSKSNEGVIRTIYEYHRVAIDMQKIRPRTVVILEPLPTCNLAEDCSSCINQKINFDCSWCPAVQRCSDGIDWQRQDWFLNKCHKLKENETKKCPSYSALSKKPKDSVPVAVVIVIVVVLILCISVAIWCFYGYSHPTTPLGIWMMEHRPSQMKAKMANMKFWKQSTPAGDKYRIESEA